MSTSAELGAAWEAAQDHARTLLARLRPDDRYRTLAASWEPVALMVHVTAAEAGVPAGQVDLAHLRYRLGDLEGPGLDEGRQRFQQWVRAGLSRMGHRPFAADDPVERAYRRYTIEYINGHEDTIGSWTSTDLNNSRNLLRDPLDAALVAERGGWPHGTRVRVVGLPTTVALGPARVIDYGDRAVVWAPGWAADHDQRTVRPGPPMGYLLAYRVPGTPSDYLSPRPVATPVAHLELDLGLDNEGPTWQERTGPATSP